MRHNERAHFWDAAAVVICWQRCGGFGPALLISDCCECGCSRGKQQKKKNAHVCGTDHEGFGTEIWPVPTYRIILFSYIYRLSRLMSSCSFTIHPQWLKKQQSIKMDHPVFCDRSWYGMCQAVKASFSCWWSLLCAATVEASAAIWWVTYQRHEGVKLTDIQRVLFFKGFPGDEKC